MKLEFNNSNKAEPLFPREAEPCYIDEKIQQYDSIKLQEWEKRYNEIQMLLNKTDKQEGMKLLFALAEEGYPDARWQLSDMYLEGQQLPESFMKAIEWDRRARFAEGMFREKRT